VIDACEYQFNDIKIGQTETFELVITESMLDDFARLSGDYNPLHMNENYANSTIFKRRVCHGMLVASFFSQLVGMYIPGKNALYFSQTLKFIHPCFIDDVLKIEGKVLDKSESTKLITLKTSVFNDIGKCIIDGQAKVLVR
jgi:3-hydroxybutyryl-CoA dehydratase|tara:strand:+ start:944 stop:1366 length:423 start_codon:yes stop_codon:yes gene_type:complete